MKSFLICSVAFGICLRPIDTSCQPGWIAGSCKPVHLPAIPARVKVRDSTAVLRMDMGFYIGFLLRHLLTRVRTIRGLSPGCLPEYSPWPM